MKTEFGKKTYVFITGPIIALGGSQLYVLRKMQWLRSQGWDVVVFSTLSGEIVVPEFKEFEKNIHLFLSIPYHLYSHRRQKIFLDKLISQLKPSDRYIFQTHTPDLATWGEVLAKKTNGSHIAHLLGEGFNKKKFVTMALMSFKLKQGLLWGINDAAIQKLFSDRVSANGRGLAAVGCSFGENVIDSPFEHADSIQEADFNILIFGRLEKDYVYYALKAVSAFAEKYDKKMINLLILGGSIKPYVKDNLEVLIKGRHNIHAHWLGTVFPVPRKIFQIADVCIAGAGCARIATIEKCLCITVDSQDHYAIGILGITTTQSIFRCGEEKTDILTYIEDVLIHCKYSSSDIVHPVPTLDFSKHQVITETANQKEYFNFNNYRKNLHEWFLFLIIAILGVSGYFKLVKVVQYGLSMKRRLRKKG